VPVGGFLVDHEVERHDAGEQLQERLSRRVVASPELRRQRDVEAAADRRHRQCGVLDRLDEHAAALRPLLDRRLVEDMPREPVHLADVTGLRECLRVDVVNREVVAPRHDESIEVAILPRHPVQGLRRRHHCKRRNQCIIRLDQELCPGAVDRGCLDKLPVARQAAFLHDAAVLQQCERAAIRHAVQRHRQFQGVGAHT
jgi:hypothetical protein